MKTAKSNPWIFGRFNGVGPDVANRLLKENAEIVTKQQLPMPAMGQVIINNRIELGEN